MTDRQGVVVLANREIERLFGYDRHELLGQPVEMLIPAHSQSGHARQRETYARDPDRRVLGSGRDLLGLRKDGTEIPLEIGLTPVETAEGAFVLASVVDITARRTAEDNLLKLEAQLRQAQKMEAVGTLAGGIAHDFNNILGVILGFVDVLHGSITDPVSLNDLSEIERAALRGRDLVNRIVSFARHAEPELRAVELAEVLQQAAKLLRVILPPQVEFRVSIAEGTPHIKADLTCLHQVIINLGTNAIQAMPGGGLLELGVEPLYVRDHAARSHPHLREGWYAHLFVRDNGIGMAPASQARIFEPFFTTKPAGSGTGLGLAIVQGIMKDHDGACLVESALGHGTRVRCLFPAVARSAVETPRAVHAVTLGSGEHVLLLDDEPELRDIGVRRLLRLG
ncbi:MAG: two-component system sensor histidine kinase NtrB, partial [Gemmatimonadaceae bacterium]